MFSDKCAEIIKQKGISSQKRKLVEEGFELIEAVTEMQVSPSRKNLEHIAEELADCFVVWTQFAEFYGISWAEIVKIANMKAERTLQRLNQ